MTSRVSIGPGTARDLSWIAAHLRHHDLVEIAEVEPHKTSSEIAMMMMLAPNTSPWVAYLDGRPTVAFGTIELHPGVGVGWAWGTKDFTRCVPAITRWIMGPLGEALIHAGYRRVEVRAMQGHDLGRWWLRRLGFRAEVTLKRFGRTRDFTLWAITDEQWRARHVHGQSTFTAAAAGAADPGERAGPAGRAGSDRDGEAPEEP